jgi:hypothetical protein
MLLSSLMFSFLWWGVCNPHICCDVPKGGFERIDGTHPCGDKGDAQNEPIHKSYPSVRHDQARGDHRCNHQRQDSYAQLSLKCGYGDIRAKHELEHQRHESEHDETQSEDGTGNKIRAH